MARPVKRPQGEPLPPPPVFCWPLRCIAERHGMSPDALVRASGRGELTLQRRGRGYVVAEDEYRRWLDSTTSRPASFFAK